MKSVENFSARVSVNVDVIRNFQQNYVVLELHEIQ